MHRLVVLVSIPYQDPMYDSIAHKSLSISTWSGTVLLMAPLLSGCLREGAEIFMWISRKLAVRMCEPSNTLS